MVDLEALAHLESFVTDERKNRFNEVLGNRTRFITVATEDVFQLHNASAVIRSCDIFGIQEVHLIEERFGKRLDKNIAMGAQQWVDTHTYPNSQSCIDNLRKLGYSIIATTPLEGSTSLSDFQLERPVALFFGTEKEGLSDTVLDEADSRLRIPMHGFTRSLNISVSAAIILHHLTRQLHQSELSWHLSEEDKLLKRWDWTKKSINQVDEILERYYKEAKN